MPRSRPPHLSVVKRGRLIEVRRRRSFVEALVFPGSSAKGVPIAEWVLPISLRYDLETAAHLADVQTELTEE